MKFKTLLPLLFITAQACATNVKLHLKNKLKTYHLDVEKSPATYNHKTEIIAGSIEEGFALDPEISGFATAQNLRLNQSLYFDPDFILKSHLVREYHTKPKYFKENIGQIGTTTTSDGKTITYTYFNRNSDTLLVVGSGFTNDREVMSPFIDMFVDYDIVIFDYRGHGYKEMYLGKPSTWDFNVTKMFFGANTKEAMMGAEEEKDVFAVVEALKERKNFAQVIGLGICYSAAIFIKAAAIRETQPAYAKATARQAPLFDKLILDGTWLSLENFLEKLMVDPKRICSPQKGGWKENWLVKKKWCKKFLVNVAQALFTVRLLFHSLYSFMLL